jgi:ATP-dependent DNA helicase RecG
VLTRNLADKPVDTLRGVGPGTRSALQRLGIRTLGDLMFHLPFRYEDRTHVTPPHALRQAGEYLVDGRILSSRPVRTPRASGQLVVITDGSAELTLRFFRLHPKQASAFVPGRFIRAFGSVQQLGRTMEMAHPDFQVTLDPPAPPPRTLTPVYPATARLAQTRLRNLVGQACALQWPEEDGYPWTALRVLHAPPGNDLRTIEEARRTLALDELTAYRLVMNELSRERGLARAFPLPRGPGLGRRLLESLGFELTGAQRRVVTEILADLERPVPMLRLLQGDVGSGKTIVAAFAAIRATECRFQTAIMAPTELLATQLHDNLRRWFAHVGIEPVLLTSATPAKDKRRANMAIAAGEAKVVIGTHALIENSVSFARLALVIIDEQHRFGVHQRMRLSQKGETPHQLVMTATPIPRTLNLSLYSDMDVSVLDELPKGRSGISTRVMSQRHRGELLDWLKAMIRGGEQAYWVCTLIEASDDIPARAAEEAFELLMRELPGVRIGLLHGRLKADAKSRVFEQFRAAEIDLLVATTVIEVGVDVPNANAIIIENPERLGLAQLHQLRGRVGRGSRPGYCILLHDGRLSTNARERLRALRDTRDGFKLAEKDLELRGPGEVLGTRQTGDAAFRFATGSGSRPPASRHLVARTPSHAGRVNSICGPVHNFQGTRWQVIGCTLEFSPACQRNSPWWICRVRSPPGRLPLLHRSPETTWSSCTGKTSFSTWDVSTSRMPWTGAPCPPNPYGVYPGP